MKPICIFAICALQVLSLFLFLSGFFPIKKPVAGNANQTGPDFLSSMIKGANLNWSNGLSCFTGDNLTSAGLDKPRTPKLVLMVIDALRSDFVLETLEKPIKNMNFLQNKLLNQQGFGFTAKTQSPTVTMPRIKAMTAGTVPAFVDVLLNFISSEFTEDNLIEQLRRYNRSVLFFGDETWLKLFPGHFSKSDGTTSFFVSDYTEVDDNVTSQLDKVIHESPENWDVIILHYLGLDHIGHSFGPRSPLLAQKLAEMDEIVKKTFNYLSSIDQKSIIVILGDHGMSDIGSHGGATPAETSVPVVFLSPFWGQFTEHHSITERQIQQIDLVPTLASILEIPIPQNNLGVVIEPVLKRVFAGDLLKLFGICYSNAWQIYQVYKNNVGSGDYAEKDYENLKAKFFEILKSACKNGKLTTGKDGESLLLNSTDEFLVFCLRLRETLITSFTEYHLPLMIIGFTISFLVLVVLIFDGFCEFLPGKATKTENSGPATGKEEHQIWYFLWPSFLLCLLAESLAIDWKYQSVGGLNFNLKKAALSKFGILTLLIFHRTSRSWNQTGVKWAYLPDIGDWLNRETNEMWKGAAVLTGLFVFLVLCLNELKTVIGRILFCITQIAVVWFQLLNKSFSIPWIHWLHVVSHPQKGLWQARFVFIMSIGLCFAEKRISEGGFGLILLLLNRAYNIPLLALIMASTRLFCLVETKNTNNKLFMDTVAVYWFGFVAYFYLGNSNSLGTIDVSVGYVGQQSYHALFVGILMLTFLYTGPLLVWINTARNFTESPLKFLELLLLLKALPVSIYMIFVILQRYHLFVWSVFAPKLVYECVHSFVLNVFVGIYSVKKTFYF